MNYGFEDSFKKFFQIVSLTTRSTIEWSVTLGGKKFNFSSNGTSQLVLSPAFYRDDSCQACGKCCSSLGFYLFLTESDYTLNSKKDRFSSILLHNGISIYTLPFTVETSCPFLDGKLCNIQDYKPIHCHFPHIRARQIGRNSILFKAPYGRRTRKRIENRCPIDSFGPYSREGRQVDIRVLEHLARVQRDLHLDTQLVENAVKELTPFSLRLF